MELSFAYVEEAVHRIGYGFGRCAVAAEDLARIHDPGISCSDEGLLPDGTEDPVHLSDEADILYRSKNPDPVGKRLQHFAKTILVQADIGACFDIEYVIVRPHRRNRRMTVVDERIGPPSVIEEVAGSVAGATYYDDGRSRLTCNIIRNLRGSDLQTLGKLDGDGGEPSGADPFHNPVKFQIEHLDFT